ncbi:MAG: hypothetical protein V7L28_07215 [Nostoc sp.]
MNRILSLLPIKNQKAKLKNFWLSTVNRILSLLPIKNQKAKPNQRSPSVQVQT